MKPHPIHPGIRPGTRSHDRTSPCLQILDVPEHCVICFSGRSSKSRQRKQAKIVPPSMGTGRTIFTNEYQGKRWVHSSGVGAPMAAESET